MNALNVIQEASAGVRMRPADENATALYVHTGREGLSVALVAHSTSGSVMVVRHHSSVLKQYDNPVRSLSKM